MNKNNHQQSIRFSYRNSSNRFIGYCYLEFIDNIVIVTEPPQNPGMSICNAFEELFVEVCRFFKLNPQEIVWIEHWPAWSEEEGGYERKQAEYSLVKFSFRGNSAYNPQWIYLGNNRESALSKFIK